MLSRLCKPIHQNKLLYLPKSHRNFAFGATPRHPGWRRRRFYRRFTIFSIGFAAWFFIVDADFITYSLDLYRRKANTSPYDQWFGNKYNSKDFSNKTIWIVGSSSGIGEYIAKNLCSLEEGAPKRIIISARRVNELNRVANDCNNINPMIDIMVKPLDITDFSQNESDYNDQYLASIFDEIGEDIDILILNSGMIQKCRAEYASMDSFKRLAEINMFGPIGFAQSMVKQWR